MSFSITNLHFSATWLTATIGIVAWIAVLVLAWIGYSRAVRKRRAAWLEGLRVLCASAVLFMLFQPEWLTEIEPDTRPQVVVLYDDSYSMRTEDARTAAGSDSAVVTRRERVEALLSETEIWDQLGDDNEVVFQPFGTVAEGDDPGLTGTNVFDPINSALEDIANLRSIILITDGDVTSGPRPVVAAQKMNLREVPLYTIATGSETRLPDLDLLSVTAPTYGVVGENVQIPFTVRSSLDRDINTLVRLRDKDGREVTKPIAIPARSTVSNSILWRLESEGTATLELSLPVAQGELVERNNAESFTIAGRPEKIRVLVVETRPRWEYRFIRNALSRDPGVEVDCLLLHPQLGAGGGPDYIADFPSDLETLQKYDVIFLGDVGIGPDMLTAEQAELLKGLVENQASGIVFIPGQNGHIFSLIEQESPLADLIPVQLDAGKRGGTGEAIASSLDLTEEGSGSLLTMLADTEEKNPAVWRSLPGFHWFAPVVRAKGGSNVLAVHKDRRNEFGRIPLIVTRSAGYGKVLFMGIDSAWRWRRGVEDLYHYRFWGQVARWMSYQRNVAAGERIRLYFTPERPSPGDSVALTANAFNEDGAPLQDGTVTVDLTAPDGITQRIQLESDDSTWGTFASSIITNIPGEWKIRAFPGDDEDAAIESQIVVQGTAIEKIGQPARPDVLEELARIARGRALTPDQLEALVSDIRSLPTPKPLVDRFAIWSHWITAAAIILLLSLFWLMRKLNGTF